MTEAENLEQQNQTLQVIRQSLINNIFQQYHEFLKFLKALPIHHQLPAVQHAFIELDTGMLWLKEVLSVSPIILPTQNVGNVENSVDNVENIDTIEKAI